MKRLLKLEQQIGKYGERLVAHPPPSSPRQNQWVVNEIRTILDKRMAEHSSSPEFDQHFSEIFCGLENISSHSITRDPLAPDHSEPEILRAFDERYFKGQATFGFTKKLMMDPRVAKVDHFTRAVAHGGTILKSWTAAQRELFQLYVANKLWIVGQRAAAKQKLAEDYEALWSRKLAESDLPKGVLELLMRAFLSTRALPRDQILSDIAHNWRSIYVFWRLSLPVELSLAVKDAHLVEALNVASSSIVASSSGKASVPQALAFTPSSAKLAPHQIRGALLDYAKTTKNTHILDPLLASSEKEEDKVTEIGVISTKLALAWA